MWGKLSCLRTRWQGTAPRTTDLQNWTRSPLHHSAPVLSQNIEISLTLFYCDVTKCYKIFNQTESKNSTQQNRASNLYDYKDWCSVNQNWFSDRWSKNDGPLIVFCRYLVFLVRISFLLSLLVNFSSYCKIVNQNSSKFLTIPQKIRYITWDTGSWTSF